MGCKPKLADIHQHVEGALWFDRSHVRNFGDAIKHVVAAHVEFIPHVGDRLLSKANVAVVPGAAFGDDRTVRLSYATSIDIIKKGLDRFQDFCRTL